MKQLLPQIRSWLVPGKITARSESRLAVASV
jgi:hypothetical protein